MISMRVCSIHPKNPHPISNKHAASSPYLKPKWFKSIKQFQTIKGVQKPHLCHCTWKGAKKSILTACHSGKLKLAFTSPNVISTSPKSFLTSRIDLTVLLQFEFLKKHHLPIGQVKNRIHQPKTRIHQPWLSDTTFFAR